MIPSFENVFVGKTPEGKHQNINCGSLGDHDTFCFYAFSVFQTVSNENCIV